MNRDNIARRIYAIITRGVRPSDVRPLLGLLRCFRRLLKREAT